MLYCLNDPMVTNNLNNRMNFRPVNNLTFMLSTTADTNSLIFIFSLKLFDKNR